MDSDYPKMISEGFEEFQLIWTRRLSGQETGRSTFSRELATGSLIPRNDRPSVVHILVPSLTGRGSQTTSTTQSSTPMVTPTFSRRVSTTDLTTGHFRLTQELPRHSLARLATGGSAVLPSQGRASQRSYCRLTSPEQM